MYQIIDDPEEQEQTAKSGPSILPFLIGGLLACLVLFTIWLFSPGHQPASKQNVETPASRAAYLTALREQSPALRRARLLDYQRTHPDTDREGAIQDQLDVINAAEELDWEALTRAIHDDRADAESKQVSLLTYETKWNGRLLGGRGEALDALRAVFDDGAATEAPPDRSLEEGKSPIPNSVPDEILAGAPPERKIAPPVYVPPVVIKKPVGPVIVEAKIRRDANPEYPRKAQRRNIGAIITLSLDIDEKGRVDDTHVVSVETTRYPKSFTRAAVRAAKRTRFHPKTIDGVAVPSRGVQKRYIFRVE